MAIIEIKMKVEPPQFDLWKVVIMESLVQIMGNSDYRESSLN